jgi:hypothetical protein
MSRAAVSSFILGLGSLVFGFLSGIPAILLGTLALVRMRSGKPKLRGRALALIGVGLGTVLSLTCGAIIGAGFWIAQSITRTTDPQEVAAFASELGRFDFPDQVKPRRADSAPFGIPTIVVYHERPKRWKSDTVIGLVDLSPLIAPTEQQARRQAELQPHLFRGNTTEARRIHTITVDGNEIEIAEEERSNDEKSRFRNYVGALPKSDGFILVIVSLRQTAPPPDSDASAIYALTTDNVLAFFASYRPPADTE